jgi:hypothetical protein
LVSSSPIIFHWLAWNPGDGTEIRIGEDKILGMGDRSLLSPELRHLSGFKTLFISHRLILSIEAAPFQIIGRIVSIFN